ncbi:MAG TPA: hypothetical protein VF092_11915 [Longimicrobium sp.]
MIAPDARGGGGDGGGRGLLIGFGWWGLETVSGQRRFDEMSGMIPLGAGFLGAILLLVGLVVLFLDARRRGRMGRG